MNIDDLRDFSLKLEDALATSDSDLIAEIDDSIRGKALNDVLSELMTAKESLTVAVNLIDSLTHSEPYDAYDPDSLDAIAAIADQFDESGLTKEASVLDQILLTIGSDKKKIQAIKQAELDELNRLREKYRSQEIDNNYAKANSEHNKEIKAEQAIDVINEKVRTYRPLEAALSTRYSPDMPGVSLIRIGDNVYQCPITKKIFDFRAGFTTNKGNKVPGGEVSNQTQQLGFNASEHSMFSTRQQSLTEKL